MGRKDHWLRNIPLALAVFGCIALAGMLTTCAGGTSAAIKSTSPTALEGIQRRIAALPCPPGVSSALWGRLTGELMGQLEKCASGEEIVAGPPLDERSAVDDLTATEEPLGTVRLKWCYKNTGDYDLNGEANVSDLTPIGLYFNATPSSADWAEAKAADGDGNDEVNIADITPLGLHFMQSVTEYRVEYRDSANKAEMDKLEVIPMDPEVRESGEWPFIEVALAEAQDGYYRVVPYYNDERGIEGVTVHFTLNQPPTAELTADPQIGQPPLAVSFDASGSSDPDPGELHFAWDWEGDGVVDYVSGTTPQVQHEYSEQGDYAPVVHVTDTRGVEATALLPVYCHAWEIHAIDAEFYLLNAGIIGGKPAFAYSRHDTDHEQTKPLILCYARSRVDVPSSSKDWDFEVVDPSFQDSVGHWLPTVTSGAHAFIELDGRPAIVQYCAQGRYAWYLDYALVADPAGPSDWVVSKICDGTNGSNVSAFVVDGHAYVLFCSMDDPEVHLARALVAYPEGPEDWELTTITSIGDGPSTSYGLASAYINGCLCAAITSQEEQELYYASCSTLSPMGPEDWQVTTIGSGRFSSYLSSLTSTAGYPCFALIAMNDDDQFEIRSARALAATPQNPEDWSISPALVSDRINFCSMTGTESSFAIATAIRQDNDLREVLMLFPSRIGMEGLDYPWLVDEVNPIWQWYDSYNPQVVYNDGHLICFYQDAYTDLKCATADVTAHYSP